MMFAELQTIPSPEVLWWALVPLLLTGGGAVVLLTFASIKSNLPSWFSALWVAGISTAGFISLFPIWNRIAEEGPKTFPGGQKKNINPPIFDFRGNKKKKRNYFRGGRTKTT